jgi:hypoxanthine phosphoribosyltransferase
VLFTADEVKDKVAELGQQICRDYKGKKLAIIGVLNGAFIFTAGEYMCSF